MMTKYCCSKRWVVAHDGTTCKAYLCVTSATVSTGQPFVEYFTVEADAIARATELGWVFEEESV